MFSIDRFSLSRFSLGAEGNVIQVEGSFSAELKSVSGVAVPVSTSAFMVEVFRGTSKGTIAIPFRFDSEAEMQADVTMNADVLMWPSFFEGVGSVSFGSRNENIHEFWSDETHSKTWGSKRMHRGFDFAETGTAYSFASKNVIRYLFGAEFLTVLTDAGKQATDQAIITIAIPPGGEIRIDSDTFRVLLDGENILYAQEGDWINVAREVLYLDVESATGGALEGSITYQERYL